MEVFLPVNSVLGIYARENGQGMIFDDEDDSDNPTPPEPDPISPGSGKKPSLKLVK
jgi:stringent starvation protein B